MSTEIAKAGHPLVEELARWRIRIAEVLPRHLDAARMTRLALSAAGRDEKLLKCTPRSFCQAVLVAARLGLEPDGTLGSAYLIPYGNTCTLVPGYRGLIDLARRSGSVLSIEAHLVHEEDDFILVYGTTPKLRHVPRTDGPRGEIQGAYALARLKGDVAQYDYMDAGEVEAIRAGKNSTPWRDHWGEMAKKTVIRRLCKSLPMSVELAAALTLQAGAEAESPAMLSEVAADLEVDAGQELPAVGVGKPAAPPSKPAKSAEELKEEARKASSEVKA